MKYQIWIFASVILFSIQMLCSCVDEEIKYPNEDSITDVEYTGDAISFKVKLDRDLSSRGSELEDYENYVDVQNKFRVMFFTEQGDFLFGAIDRTVTALNNDGASSNWYVRVPMNYIVDRKGNEYDIDRLKDYLKKRNFKIAILANWPNIGEDGKETSYDNRQPNWGYYNSVLCPLGTEGRDVKNINDLHHLAADDYYTDTSTKDRPTRKDCYDFIMNNDKMGIHTDWVEMRDINEGWNGSEAPEGSFKDMATAETWIRKNCDPYRDYRAQIPYLNETPIYRHYKNLWLLWDFNAAYKYQYYNNIDAYKNTWGNNPWGDQWHQRNGNNLSRWLYSHNNGYTFYDSFNIDGLQFVPTSAGDNLSYICSYNYNYGLVLRKAEELGNTNGNYIDEDKQTPSRGYLKFIAPATGTLRIKCGGYNGDATMKIQLSSNVDKTITISGFGPTDIEFDGNPYRNISITGDPEPIYIWCSSGDLIIYAVEWICSNYLQYTDRIGIAPTSENPIPMYGVQNFSALGDWEPGTTKDVSAKTSDNGNVKYISLIRSLAKVEVYLPNKVKHIYMRSIIRKARCEPMDVARPTELSWGTSHTAGQCEWFAIKDYGSGFTETTEPKDKTQLSAYTNWLSWFYWSWKENAKWTLKTSSRNKVAEDLNDSDYDGWDFDSHDTNEQKNIKYPTSPQPPAHPHLFNPDINRSDFCHFLYAGESQGYHKYILYMPDKNISDPNYPGITSSIAKVAHVEYRYDDMTDDLEDNHCHRIYFTDYSSNSVIGGIFANEYETKYEKKTSYLNQNWPIMRNHVYRFYVGGTGIYRQAIQAKVSEWGRDKIIVNW